MPNWEKALHIVLLGAATIIALVTYSRMGTLLIFIGYMFALIRRAQECPKRDVISVKPHAGGDR